MKWLLVTIIAITACKDSARCTVIMSDSATGAFQAYAIKKYKYHCSRGHSWEAYGQWVLLTYPDDSEMILCPYCIQELLANTPSIGKVTEEKE